MADFHDTTNEVACGYCMELSVDILSDTATVENLWTTAQSRHATLSYTSKHQHGSVMLLANSAKHCRMCHLIHRRFLELENAKDASTYYIFVWRNVPTRCEFQIAVGTIDVFTKGVRYWLDREHQEHWH